MPHGWRPDPARSIAVARRNMPLAGADAIEWGIAPLDIAILGLFFAPAIVGIYYVAQQVASLPRPRSSTAISIPLAPITSHIRECV